MTTEQKKYIEDVGHCELCGSKKSLELHHIIPMVCEPPEHLNVLKHPINLDTEDNWICVCGSCHAKLTPKNLLVKYGMNNSKLQNNAIETRARVYETFCDYVMKHNDGWYGVNDWFDAVQYACRQ